MPPKNRQQRKLAKLHETQAPAHWLDRETVMLALWIKILLMAFAVVAVMVMRNMWLDFPYQWLTIWNQWDGPHYIDIARDGYVTSDVSSKDQWCWIVFYPLYPWTIRLISVIVRDYVLAAHVISLVGTIASALLLQRLAELDFEKNLARSAVIFMLIFPTAYFFNAVYTESLFIPIMLGSFLAARKGRWALAGGLGALASMSRVNGMLLIPALAAEAYTQYRESGRKIQKEWLWILVVAAGLLTYLAVNYYVWGDPFKFQKVLQEKWYKTLTWPWVGISTTMGVMTNWKNPLEAHLVGFQEFFFIVLGFVCLVWCWKRTRPSYAVWVTLNWLLVTSTSWIQSTPRYVLSLFPIFFLFAKVAEKRPMLGTLIMVWSLIFLALFTGQFVQGYWAF